MKRQFSVMNKQADIKSRNSVSLFALIIFSFCVFFPVSGKDIKILAIGNSFSEDAVEQYLYELALEGGDNLIIGNAYRGGQGLQSHWSVVNGNKAEFEYRKVVAGVKTNTTGKTLLSCIEDEDWDYITFQQVSQDSGIESTYEPWLTNLLAYVRQHATNVNVAFALHRTWAYSEDSGHGGFSNYGNNQLTMFNAIINAVNSVFEKHSDISFVIPAGTAIQNGRASFIGDNFCRDGYHLTYGMGRYTAACTWLEAITGQNPVGKNYKPDAVSEIEAKVAQYAAHYAIENPGRVTDMGNFGFEGDNTIEPAAPVKINFGSISSLAEWNDITPSGKYIFGLKDTEGNDTEMVIILDDDFSGTNTEGVQNTATALNMPNDVSASCVWGYNKGSFGGGSFQETGGFLFSHLNKKLVYDFYIFASRKNVSDNRETEFVMQGENRKRNYLDAANNGTGIAFIKGIKPAPSGEIKLTVSPGENNTNGNNFYYINALQIVAREYEDGDFDDDEPDPMIEIEEGKKYYIRHVKSGLYLHALPGEASDFCLNNSLERQQPDYHFLFEPIYAGKPVYSIRVNDRYINAGEDNACISGDATDADSGQIRLEAEADLLSFKMIAIWKSSPDHYLHVPNPSIAAYMYANGSEGDSWTLEEVKDFTHANASCGQTASVSLTDGYLAVATGGKATVNIADVSGRTMGSYSCPKSLSIGLNYPKGIYFVFIEEESAPVAVHKIYKAR